MKLVVGPLGGHLLFLRRRRVEQTGFLIGRLTGDSAVAYAFVPVRNTAGSGARFLGDPWDTVVAHGVADSLGLGVVALFHTHPHCNAVPSSLDVDGMKHWPYIWLIAGVDGIRAWKLQRGSPVEVPVE